MAEKRRIQNLYYIAPIENLPPILERGILSHSEVERQNIAFTSIYDDQIVNDRKQRTTPDGRNLWEFANLYFNPRNPMLYRVVNKRGRENIVVLAVKQNVLDISSFISIGNAASPMSDILPKDDGLQKLRSEAIWSVIQSDRWKQEDCEISGCVP